LEAEATVLRKKRGAKTPSESSLDLATDRKSFDFRVLYLWCLYNTENKTKRERDLSESWNSPDEILSNPSWRSKRY